jgi:hypothetical protein
LKEAYHAAVKIALLLLVCNYTYNAGLLNGNITTGDTI